MTNVDPEQPMVPESTVETALEQTPQRDRWSTRAVVVILGVVIVAALAETGVLLMTDRTVPNELWLVVSGALGSVATLLSSTRTR